MAYIYILKHKSGSPVKIGETTRNPQERLHEYSKTYDLKGFIFHKAYNVPTNARQDIEKIVHESLKDVQFSGLAGAREIFACDTTTAEAMIERAIGTSRVLKKERELEKKLERYNQDFQEWQANSYRQWQNLPETKKLETEIKVFFQDNPLSIKTVWE